MNMNIGMGSPESGMEKKKTFREVVEPTVSRMNLFNTPYQGDNNEEISIIDAIEAGTVSEYLMFEDAKTGKAIILLMGIYEELKKNTPDQTAIEKMTKKLEDLI